MLQRLCKNLESETDVLFIKNTKNERWWHADIYSFFNRNTKSFHWTTDKSKDSEVGLNAFAKISD